MLARANIPPLYYDVKFSKIPDTCNHKKVIETYMLKIRKNIESGRGLFLWGDYSQGKSAIGCIILKHALCTKIIGCWYKCNNIASDVIQERMFDGVISVKERLETVPILVLDELFCHDDKRDAYVEDIVRDRVSGGLATIFTSNYSPQKLKLKYPALAEVLKECVVPVLVSGHDFRADIAAINNREVT